MIVRTVRLMTMLVLCLSLSAQIVAQENQAGEQPPAFEPSEEVLKTLNPLFQSIATANVSRATVQLSADSLVNGAVVDTQKSTFQIAAIGPDKFTIYLKEPSQRSRIYCNGKSMVVALAPDAYYRLPDAMKTGAAVTGLPVPLGPYPEPVLALSLAGADPAPTFLTAMKSVEIVDRGKFRGKVDAIHVRGVQDDNVSWDFWITQDKSPKPLRLSVDLTTMLRATNQVQMPEGFSYLLRFDFLSWRVTGEVDAKLFEYQPPKEAKEYKSLDDYYESVAGAVGEHPLLGKEMPEFEAETLAGKKISSQQLKGKVTVIDFWATWCAPCSTAMPVLLEVTKEYADKDVVFLAVNVGEEPAVMKGFLKEQKWDFDAIVDKDTKISAAFAAAAIPLTIVIGKTGIIESVHMGFPGPEGLKQRLSDELEVLSIGGRIGPAEDPKQ